MSLNSFSFSFQRTSLLQKNTPTSKPTEKQYLSVICEGELCEMEFGKEKKNSKCHGRTCLTGWKPFSFYLRKVFSTYDCGVVMLTSLDRSAHCFVCIWSLRRRDTVRCFFFSSSSLCKQRLRRFFLFTLPICSHLGYLFCVEMCLSAHVYWPRSAVMYPWKAAFCCRTL